MNLARCLKHATTLAHCLHRHMATGDDAAARCSAKYLRQELVKAADYLNGTIAHIDRSASRVSLAPYADESPNLLPFLNPKRRRLGASEEPS